MIDEINFCKENQVIIFLKVKNNVRIHQKSLNLQNVYRSFKSKIHRVTVTASDLNYIGSITIDEDLIDAAGLVVGERVYIVNVK